MKLKTIIITLILSSSILLLTGCLENHDNRFIGTWINDDNENDEITLLSDGRYSTRGITGTWEITDNKLILNQETGVNAMATFNFEFKNNDQQLTLTTTNGQYQYNYTKQ